MTCLRAIATSLCVVACAPEDAASSTEPPVALSARAAGRATDELENLRAFAHLYGYVRFFHPSDAAARADWASATAAGVAQARAADSLGELADRLEATYRPLAPSMQLWTSDAPTPAPVPAPGARDELVYWQYQGFPGTPISLYRPPYRQVRVGAVPRSRARIKRRAFTEMPAPDARVDDELAPGLRVRLPIVLHRDAAADTRHASGDAPTPDDLDVRYAAVIEVWNVLRHFYPYQDAVADDWDALLEDALVDARDDATTQDTVATLRRLVHRIRDGHGEVGHVDLPRRAILPVRIELIDGRAVVTGTSQPESFRVGDVVERIDGRAMSASIERAAAELSGSERWRRFRAAAWVVPSGPAERTATLDLRRGERTRSVSASFVREGPPRPRRPEAIHRYPDGVFYVDLTRSDWDTLEARMPEIAAAPGVVFDLRGYPNDTHHVLEHLLDAPEDAVWMHVPRWVEPGGEAVAWHGIGWHLRPAQPRIEGRVAFLVSAEAISYAESMLGYVEAHDLGTVIGSTPSAGTNGDIVRFDTTGGYWVIFTGMRVTHHDGRRFHLRGVTPDLVVQSTLTAVRRGVDEQLEAALAAVAG